LHQVSDTGNELPFLTSCHFGLPRISHEHGGILLALMSFRNVAQHR